MAHWARHGVPLGMSQEIPSSNGVFPPVEMEEVNALPPELEEQLEVANYRSMHEDVEAAKGELDRYIEKGFAVLLDKNEAAEAFGRGTVSRLALISKMKEGPQGAVMKHRIIIDMRRSGGNGRAKVPERITLPRVNDMVKAIQKLWRERRQDLDESDPGVELVGADLSDAYCHFGVAGPELKNCPGTGRPGLPRSGGPVSSHAVRVQGGTPHHGETGGRVQQVVAGDAVERQGQLADVHGRPLCDLDGITGGEKVAFGNAALHGQSLRNQHGVPQGTARATADVGGRQD